MPCQIEIALRDGRTIKVERDDYEGFLTHPMSWEHVVEKFNRLAAPHAERALRDEIVEAVANLEHIPVAELMRRLARAGGGVAASSAIAGSAPAASSNTAPVAPRARPATAPEATHTKKTTKATKTSRARGADPETR